MFTRKLSFTIGLNDKNGNPYPEARAIEVLTAELGVHGIDAFTLTRHTGFWKGQPEESITATILVKQDASVLFYVGRLAQTLALLLNQECVLWEVEETQAGLAYSHISDIPHKASSASSGSVTNDNLSTTEVAA